MPVTVNFDPSKHPRGERGRFATVGSAIVGAGRATFNFGKRAARGTAHVLRNIKIEAVGPGHELFREKKSGAVIGDVWLQPNGKFALRVGNVAITLKTRRAVLKNVEQLAAAHIAGAKGLKIRPDRVLARTPGRAFATMKVPRGRRRRA